MQDAYAKNHKTSVKGTFQKNEVSGKTSPAHELEDLIL